MKTVRQVGRFGLVGLVATCVHAFVFFLAAQLAGIPPLTANLMGFVPAFAISFSAHDAWTFTRESDERGRRQQVARLARFLIVSLSGLLMNSAIVFVVTGYFGLPASAAVPLLLTVVPLLSFVLCKTWAFK